MDTTENTENTENSDVIDNSIVVLQSSVTGTTKTKKRRLNGLMYLIPTNKY